MKSFNRSESPSGIISLIPFVVLVATLVLVITVFGGDALSGGSQVALMFSAAVVVAISMILYKIPWKVFEDSILENIHAVGTSIIILLLIIGGNASGCEAFLHDIDRTLLLVMLLTFLLCAGGFFAGYWTGKLLRLDYPTTETLCLNTGLRNISAGSVLAMEYFPPDVLFPVAFTPLFLQLFASLVVKVLQTTPSGKKYLAEKDISYLP